MFQETLCDLLDEVTAPKVPLIPSALGAREGTPMTQGDDDTGSKAKSKKKRGPGIKAEK
jgi:hypothetical protein